MNTRKIDVSLLITFHSEGILAQMTLNSVERCRLYAEQHGISCEYVWVMDNIDDETKRILNEYPIDSSIVQKIEVSHGDSGASRNSGITIAKGTAIAILDGDDYYSTNWIERAWNALQEYGYQSIIHPEFVLNFGTVKLYGWQIDQKSDEFKVEGLFRENFWTSALMAYRRVYLEIPYKATYVDKTGYAYEDWHWNCQTISEGYEHRLAKKTVSFYRRKKVSRIIKESSVGGIMSYSKLFSKEGANK
ncbi:hypothetical protein CJ672_09690 [Arcobacter cryaerophilus gv. occultus]|uniref:glycosyltransferase family 2 protein n=1 Tax=Aliarcobacter cryaerophilus TaxID=28198 RepID=UPI000D01ACA1|nr:glycosyltransferase [Aliarcobacter cryaerophilus]PRM91347.1 hypothetical protein CJ672_09690 [Arcobacter cryaerophilus gv. occultus]